MTPQEIEALVATMRRIALAEAPPLDADEADIEAARDDVPEITWQELAEISVACSGAARAIETLQAERDAAKQRAREAEAMADDRPSLSDDGDGDVSMDVTTKVGTRLIMVSISLGARGVTCWAAHADGRSEHGSDGRIAPWVIAALLDIARAGEGR